MTSMTPVGGRVLTVVVSSTLVLLSAGSAQAADWDLDNLPTFDAKTLASSIRTWSLDARSLASSVRTWSLDGSVEDLGVTTHKSGETVVTLNADILFEFGKAALPARASGRIAAAVAKALKGAAVSVSGHTDNVGSDADNLKLSQARAQAVASAVKAARPDLVLTVKGFGESKPVASNADSPRLRPRLSSRIDGDADRRRGSTRVRFWSPAPSKTVALKRLLAVCMLRRSRICAPEGPLRGRRCVRDNAHATGGDLRGPTGVNDQY